MDARWLQTQFDLNPDRTKAHLANELGLEPPAISKILKGTRQIKAHEYIVMRRYFNLPVDGENAVANQSVIQPLAHDEQASFLSDGGKQSDDENWIIPQSILRQHTKTTADKIKIFTIQENLMEPAFKRDDPVLVDLSDQFPSPPGVFIISDGYSFLARQCEIVSGARPPEVKISAHDKGFTQQSVQLDDIQIIGRVIAKLQWL